MSKDQKTFRYMSRGVDSKGVNKNKQPAKGHIRITAKSGDKCVAPAKSKPKKRKTVNQPDYSTLSMDHVEWCEQSFSVSQLAHHYGDRFPLLVRVAHGYSGEFGIQLQKDTVLQIHSSGTQKRVVATDSEQRSISIPSDFPVHVYLPDSRETVSFTEAVTRRSLPLSVEVGAVGEELQNAGGGALHRGDPLYVRSCREELFLRANIISGGWVNQREVLLIPAFLPISFLVAVGMRNATQEEWSDYQNMFARSVRHLLFNLMTGYSGIVTVDTDAASPYRGSGGVPFRYSVGDYQNQPSTSSPSVITPPYQNIPKQPLAGSDNASQNQIPGPAQTYENLPAVPPKGPLLYENLPAITTEPRVKEPPKTAEKMLTNSKEPPKTAEKSKSLKKTSSTKDSTVAPHYSGSKNREPEISSSSLHHNRGFQERTPEDESQFAYDNHVTIEEVEIHPEPSRSGTPFSEIDENDIPDMFDRVIQVGEKSLEKERRNNNHLQPVTTGQIRIDLDDPVPLPPNSTRGKQLTATGRANLGKAVNVVPPTTVKSTSSRFSSSTAGKEKESTIETMDDVPAQIETLTVVDVGKCLELLNMDSHMQQFRQHQIDGKLLSDLKETVMVNEFNFTPFNASKLMRFIRGWRPKVS